LARLTLTDRTEVYDTASRRTTVTLPNGIVGTYGFDNANQLTGITYKNGGTTVGTLGYGYDLAGRRTSLTGTLAAWATPNYAPSLAYDGTNRLTSWNGASLVYDNNGNLSTFGATTYTWNARNQLTATSAGSAVFGYDAVGRRVSTTIGGTTVPFLYDGLNPVTISGNLQLAGAGLDEIDAQIVGSTTTSFLRDGLNSAVALTNSSAAITVNYGYSAYGDTAVTGTGTTSLQYTGRENDGATGLYYYRARYYSPQLGRFISEDPLGIGAGPNFYAYVAGNPISFVDPLGLTQADINQLACLARATQTDLPVPLGPDIQVLNLQKRYGPGFMGLTPNLPWPFSYIIIDSSYLKDLTPSQRVDLFDTIVHESVHLGQPWWDRSGQVREDQAWSEAARRTAPLEKLIRSGNVGCGCDK